MSVVLPESVMLGDFEAAWQWSPGAELLRAGGDAPGRLPTGVLIDHGDHNLLVSWVAPGEARPAFTLDSLLPLTVVEEATCPMCGVAGRIERGEWLPAEGGVARG
jgi:hypothetical protein